MTEHTNQYISSVIAAVKKVANMSSSACIFCSSIMLLSNQIENFLYDYQKIFEKNINSVQAQYNRQLQEFLLHYCTVLGHLTSEKWIQPALNWPTDYVFKYIDGMRKSLTALSKHLNVSSQSLEANSEQIEVNKFNDLKDMKASLERLMSQITFNDVSGLQNQINNKLREIDQLIMNSKVEHSLASIQQQNKTQEMKPKDISDLLVRFKSINIPINDLQIEDQIGAGGFGKVYRATRLSTSEIVAVKELRPDKISTNAWSSLYAEVETMASVHHKNVVELVGAHINQPYRIITRFCSGLSLFDRIHRPSKDMKPLTSTELTIIAQQVAKGMAYLHKFGIVHRDLKTLNILLYGDNTACVADFGLSSMVKENQELYGGVGTPHYTAPEVLMHMKYGPKVDTYSYGVVLWEMLTRKLPFGDMNHMAIYEHVVTRGWRLTIPPETPEGLKKLITRCWSRDPNERPDFTEIERLFERQEIYFPGAELSRVKNAQLEQVAPPMNIEYALKVLKNANDEHFSGVAYFIAENADQFVISKLREQEVFNSIMTAKKNIDAALLLAGTLFTPTELYTFMTHGAKAMLTKCIQSQQLIAAVRFCLKLPLNMLDEIKDVFIPQFVSFIKSSNMHLKCYILQLISRVANLQPYLSDISTTILDMCKTVSDQPTFDAIEKLLAHCKPVLTISQYRPFYEMLTLGFVVSPDFVKILIDANDEAYYHHLILNCLKALSKSDITDVFVSFVIKLKMEVFERLKEFDDLLPTIDSLISFYRLTSAPLIMLFQIAQIHDFALLLADSPVLFSLLQMKGNEKQILHILTFLCADEKFCSQTKYMDNILQIIVDLISRKEIVNEAVRVIAALSQHHTGCHVLTENGILDIFSQLFLAPQFADTSRALVIFRNLAENRAVVPQLSLIVSCLMQDLTDSPIDQKAEIMQTIIALTNMRPESVQEHDIQNVILEQTTRTSPPLMVLLSLRLLNTCSSSLLTNNYQVIINKIREILSVDEVYTEIVIEALNLLNTLARSVDINDYLVKIQLLRYISDVISMSHDKTLTDIFNELQNNFMAPKKLMASRN